MTINLPFSKFGIAMGDAIAAFTATNADNVTKPSK